MSVVTDKNHIYYDGKKYVLESWLKEQIEQLKKKDKLREYTYEHVLSLLEEK
jgi:hypothetical protein